MKKELLYRFFEGKTSFEEEKKIRKWMEESTENENTFMQERKMFDTILLVGGIETDEKNIPLRRKKILPVLLKVAALIILTLLIDRGFQYYQQTHTPELVQTILVPSGQRTNLILPDGTNVWVNARSTLTYPLDFAKKGRKVHLDGEAYFEVTENKNKPFIVESTKGTVEVLGTEFNVEAYSSLPSYEVALMRGKVKVSSVDAPQTIILSPDTKTVLVNGKLEMVRVDDFNPYRWREGLICFRTKTFDSIMRSFEKYYGVEIKIENPNVFKYTYTGKFRQSDGVEYALRVLQRDIRFNYTRDDENNIIYIK